MSKDTTREILRQKMSEFRAWSYSQLVSRVDCEGHLDIIEGVAPDGTPYHIDFDIMWDDHEQGNVRVIGSIASDKPLLGFIPVFFDAGSECFIMRLDGSFIGENHSA